MKTVSTCVALIAAAVLGSAPAAWAQAASGGGRPPQPPSGSMPTPSAQGGPPKASAGMSYEQLQRLGPQGFSVVLVLGDMAGTSTPDNVPPAARKALTDMKDFLPFKSYRMLDVQWTLCCGRTPVQSRLRGADGQEYDLELNTSVNWGSDRAAYVSVRFQLSDAGASHETAAVQELEAIEQQVRELRSQLSSAGTRNTETSKTDRAAIQERIAALTDRSRSLRGTRAVSHRPVIDASFRMDVGETVVVGTSRVKGGDKALIALLTAVPPKSGTSSQR